MNKNWVCTDCGKGFVAKASRKQHWQNTECNYGNGTTKKMYSPQPVQIDVSTFDDIYGDLPDGAYFAAAEENGLSIDDFVDNE